MNQNLWMGLIVGLLLIQKINGRIIVSMDHSLGSALTKHSIIGSSIHDLHVITPEGSEGKQEALIMPVGTAQHAQSKVIVAQDEVARGET